MLKRESPTMTETKHIFRPKGHVAKIKGGTRDYYHSDLIAIERFRKVIDETDEDKYVTF
jgi:hypothetical protein